MYDIDRKYVYNIENLSDSVCNLPPSVFSPTWCWAPLWSGQVAFFWTQRGRSSMSSTCGGRSLWSSITMDRIGGTFSTLFPSIRLKCIIEICFLCQYTRFNMTSFIWIFWLIPRRPKKNLNIILFLIPCALQGKHRPWIRFQKEAVSTVRLIAERNVGMTTQATIFLWKWKVRGLYSSFSWPFQA